MSAPSDGSVVEAGVDTWRLLLRCERPQGGPHQVKLGDPAEAPRYHGTWFGDHSMLAVEGHPAPGRLADPSDLLLAYDELLDSDLLPAAGFDGPEFLGISRLDSTATHVFERPADGMAFLGGMAALDWPRLKPVVYGKPPETVALTYQNSNGRILARAYDTGLLRGGFERGEAIRLEDQKRFPSGARPSDFLEAGYARQRFEKRFLPMYKAAQGVRVASLPVIAEHVAGLVAAGEMTHHAARRLVGFLVLPNVKGAPRSDRRYRSQLRGYGLVVADDFYEPVDVDLSEVLERLLDSEHWGARG